MVFCIGCGYSHTFELTGEYEGISGGFTWTLNPVKSKNVERPVFENDKGENLFALTTEDINELKEAWRKPLAW